MCSAGNSTSTTGPVTRATRPVPAAVVGPSPLAAEFSTVAVMSSSLTRRARIGQRVGAADDLADFLGDLGLPCVVRLTGQRLDQVVRVVGGRLHGAPPGGQLRGRRSE